MEYKAAMRPSEIIGANIQRLADQAGSQMALAKRLGVAASVVNRWVGGQGSKRLDSIAERLVAAGIDPMELLRLPGQALPDSELAEVAGLWATADAQTRATILHLLRMVAANSKGASSRRE